MSLGYWNESRLGPGGTLTQEWEAIAWRTRRGKKGLWIVIAWIAKTGRYFWRLEDKEGGLIQASWGEAPEGYRAFTPCMQEAREARKAVIAREAAQKDEGTDAHS